MSGTPARGAWLAAALGLIVILALLIPARAHSETAASTNRPVQAGYIDAGVQHTCAILADRTLRCWGKGLAGRLGNGSDATLLSAASAPPVNLGAGRTPRAVAAGDFHTCAILDDAAVRCWGFGANGRLGYGSTANVSLPGSAPPVNLGPGLGATAITAGASHTCVILTNGAVRCWGNGLNGRLGYGNTSSVGDDEVPGAVGPVDLGPGRTARAIAAGDFHTCAILDDWSMRCWGFDASGQLGNGAPEEDVGDNEAPASAGFVPLPAGRTARAVAGGAGHTCAILDDGSASCWGFGANGRLGYGATTSLSTPGGPVSLGAGRTATGIAVGDAHSCATLDTGAVRCWGFGGGGRLGYASSDTVGDTPGTTPNTAGPVDVGPGRSVRAITVGGAPTPSTPAQPDEGTGYTCALLDDGTMRCWGYGGDGRLGYGDESQVGGGGGSPSPAAKGPLPLGPLAGSLGDSSIGLAASAAQVPLGGSAGLSLMVTNAGPDAAALALSIPPVPGLTYTAAAASQGGFDGGSGLWAVGGLAPGGSAVLQLSARLGAPGTHVIAAQLVATSIPDRAGEDDRAAVAIAVPAPPPPPRVVKKLKPLPRSLGAKVVRFPRKGRAARLTVSGVLALPKVRPPAKCAGRVRVQARVGKRLVASTTAKLRRRARACRYTAVLRPKRAKTKSARVVRVTARFLGNAQMRPRVSRAKVVRIR